MIALSLGYLRQRLAMTLMTVLLLAIGVAIITVLLLAGEQLRDRLARDARGIDLVVGAKGSPMQLILSAVFHADVPTGNIALSDAATVSAHPMVAAAIPLALGDNVEGWRVVGTEPAYLALYGAQMATGRVWRAPFEAVLGATVAQQLDASIGVELHSAHGLTGGGPAHDEHPYAVVGVLAPTGSVLDRLILTPVESVWLAHDDERHRGPRPADGRRRAGQDAHEQHDHGEEEHHDHDAGDRHHGHGHDDGHATAESRNAHDHDGEHVAADHAGAGSEITALLVRYRTPLAAVTLPRAINRDTVMQAASPAYETARLFVLLGTGVQVLRGFGLLLIVSAAAGLLVALSAALEQRRYDLAVLRALGATRGWLVGQLLLEAAILGLAGAAAGLLLGHLLAASAGLVLPEARDMGLRGLDWVAAEWLIVPAVLLICALAVALPAWRTYREDVAHTLARR